MPRRRVPHKPGCSERNPARPAVGAPWQTRRPPPPLPTSPCPPFGKAKRAVIRLPTSVHDDRICCSTSPHWSVQDPPDCALVRRSGASVRRWSRNRNLRPAIAQLRHLPISRAWPTFPRLDPQRPHHGHQGRPPAPARRRRSARPDLLEVNDLGRNMWTDDGLAIIIEGASCEKRVRPSFCLRPRGERRSADGTQRSQDDSDRHCGRGAGAAGVHGACLPVMRASTREEMRRISSTSRSSSRLFSIHSR